MKKKANPAATPLIVTHEAIRDFRRLNTTDRLRWLDEMRLFLSQTLPEKRKRNWKLANNPFVLRLEQLRGFLKGMDTGDIREKSDRF